MYMKSLFIRFAICLPALMCLPAYSAAYQMTFEGEVHSTDFKSSGNGISVNSANVTFKNCGIDIADGSTLVVDSGKALYLQENSSLNVNGAAVAITLSDDMQFHTSQFNVLNGASASVNLLNDNLYINQGASLNVDGGSTLTLNLAPSTIGGTSVYRLAGETSLTPKAAINVTNNSHLVIRMDESWVETILSKLSSNSKQKEVELAKFGLWNIDDTSSITLEGTFLDSRYGSLTVRGGVGDFTSLGAGEIGLIWEEYTVGAKSLYVSYKGPLNPYRVLDVTSTGDPIGNGTYDSLTGSAGTATVQGKVQITESINLGEGAVVKLAGADASISYGGVTVGNKDSAGGAEIRGASDSRFTIADAVVRVDEGAPQSLSLDAALSNVLLENNNRETTLNASVTSGSLDGIQASGGAINLEQSEPGRPLTLQTLIIEDGGSVSVSGAPQPQILKAAALPVLAPESAGGVNVPDGILDFEQLATAATLPIQTMVKVEGASVSGAPASTGILIEENGSAQFGSGAVLNASLTLEPGAKLVFDDVLTMDGYLSLNPGMLLDGDLLSGIDAMKPGDCIVLIQGDGDGLQYSEDLNDNQANLYFNNIDAAFKLMADESKFGLVMSMAVPTPEPSSGMLTLMGIATLAARRRRK